MGFQMLISILTKYIYVLIWKRNNRVYENESMKYQSQLESFSRCENKDNILLKDRFR